MSLTVHYKVIGTQTSTEHVTVFPGKGTVSCENVDPIDKLVIDRVLGECGEGPSGSFTARPKWQASAKQLADSSRFTLAEASSLLGRVHRLVHMLGFLFSGICVRSVYLKTGVFGLTCPLEIVDRVGTFLHLKRKWSGEGQPKKVFWIDKGVCVDSVREPGLQAPIIFTQTSHYKVDFVVKTYLQERADELEEGFARLRPEEKKRFLLKLVKAVSELHKKGLIHGRLDREHVKVHPQHKTPLILGMQMAVVGEPAQDLSALKVLFTTLVPNAKSLISHINALDPTKTVDWVKINYNIKINSRNI